MRSPVFILSTLLALAIPGLTQSSSSSSTSPSASVSNSSSASIANASATPANSSLHTITTTITSLITPSPTNSQSASPYTTTLVLTLAINSTSFSNGAVSNATVTNSSSTALDGNSNSTANATVWQEGDDWLPFHVVIDPAYGVLGGVLILSGIPVAMLGGKLRWTSLAIASGYTVMVFTLVMILRFGVEPSLQPPSPNPPSTTLRGLYLLACLIASFFGAAAGIFFFNFAKYWVSAAGGFALGWFILATRSNGLIQSVLGRWALLGCLTVAAFCCSLVPILHEHMMLFSTAWIGATAFVLGVDCYTRAGLKEFYIYNLGFWDLFPKLDGQKYPLTQTMIIELGILAAVVLIGAAVQVRLLNMLQKRLKQIRAEEEARADAEEVSKAADRIKNVGSELQEWEEKYGTGSASRSGTATPLSPFDYNGLASPATTLNDRRGSVVLPTLSATGGDRRNSSAMSLLHKDERRGYDSLSLHSPPIGDTPTSAHFSGLEEMLSPEITSTPARGTGGATSTGPIIDPELESKIRLLEEVKRAREEVKGSLDKIRSNANTPTLGREGLSPVMTPVNASDGILNRRISSASSKILDYPERPRSLSQNQILSMNRTSTLMQPSNGHQADWESYVAERNVVSPVAASPGLRTSTNLVSQGSRHSTHGLIMNDTPMASMPWRDRTGSLMDPQLVSEWGAREDLNDQPRSAIEPPPPASLMSRRAMSYHDRPVSFLEPSVPHRERQHSNSSSRTVPLAPPIIIGSAANANIASASTLPSRPSPTTSLPRPPSMTMQRTMTYEELADRHRKRISKLQDPVTAKMKEEVDLANARAQWERQRRAEREEMRKREQERMAMAQSSGDADGAGFADEGRRGGGARGLTGTGLRKEEVLKNADEWRRSVHTGLDGVAMAGPSRGPASRGSHSQPPASVPLRGPSPSQGQTNPGRGSMGPPRGMPPRRASQYLVN